MKIFISILLTVFYASVYLFGQPVVTYKADPDEAKKQFSNGNYAAAIKIYQLLLKKQPTSIEYNYKLAQSYLLSNSIKEKAIPPLEYIIKQPKFDSEVWYDLGKAYHYANRFDNAINAFNKFKELGGKKDSDVDRLIEMCQNGKILIQHKVNVQFENLGKDVNSIFSDFYPFITSNDQTLIFTSRRKSGTSTEVEFDGLYASDIYICTNKGDGKWSKAASVGTNINTKLDEEATDISEDGNTIIFYIDHIEVFGDLWAANKLNSKGPYLQSQPLGDRINEGHETSACIWRSVEAEQELLLLSSSRPGNFGETDIYSSRKIPSVKSKTGWEWGEPQNLGPNINTQYSEEFPHLSADGKTLYFASKGHSSMGGFDIFKSVWDEDENTWSAPKNLGYPINNSQDNMNISFTSEGRIAYMSAMREDGLGDLDIYRLILNDIEGKETIYKGFITNTDSLGPKINDAVINVSNKETNENYGTYVTNPNSGYYIMALPPGKWTMSIEAIGFKPYKEDILVFDKNVMFNPEVKKNIFLIAK